MALTGRFTFRRSFWGRIVLQVEEEKRSFWGRSKPFRKSWRDATLMDLAAPELRALIDLRYKPQFHDAARVSRARERPRIKAVPNESDPMAARSAGSPTGSGAGGAFLNAKDVSVSSIGPTPVGNPSRIRTAPRKSAAPEARHRQAFWGQEGTAVPGRCHQPETCRLRARVDPRGGGRRRADAPLVAIDDMPVGVAARRLARCGGSEHRPLRVRPLCQQ